MHKKSHECKTGGVEEKTSQYGRPLHQKRGKKGVHDCTIGGVKEKGKSKENIRRSEEKKKTPTNPQKGGTHPLPLEVDNRTVWFGYYVALRNQEKKKKKKEEKKKKKKKKKHKKKKKKNKTPSRFTPPTTQPGGSFPHYRKQKKKEENSMKGANPYGLEKRAFKGGKERGSGGLTGRGKEKRLLLFCWEGKTSFKYQKGGGSTRKIMSQCS